MLSTDKEWYSLSLSLYKGAGRGKGGEVVGFDINEWCIEQSHN